MSDEEMVAVNLGDDYYKGPYFNTFDGYPKEYLIPRSQLERWEQWEADYGQMQDEVLAVMSEQRERVLASRPKTPETPLSKAIKELYGPMLQQQLEGSVYLNQVIREEGE